MCIIWCKVYFFLLQLFSKKSILFLKIAVINECNKFNAPFDSGPLNYIINKYYNYCYLMYPNIVICNVEESTLRIYKRTIEIFSKTIGLVNC